MTNAVNTTVQWLAVGSAAIFLMVCAWHNRRHGYQKVRPMEPPVGEAILWLARLNASLSSRDDTFPTSSQRSTSSEQLVRLNAALQTHGRQASLRQANEIDAPASADAISDRPHV
jgi:hypothetical protein